jgi:hypothetical protein
MGPWSLLGTGSMEPGCKLAPAGGLFGLADTSGGNAPTPTVISLTISAAGKLLTIGLSQACDVENANGLALTDATSGLPTNLTYSSGTGTASLAFTIGGSTVVAGDACTLVYTEASGNIVAAGIGNAPLASFSESVTNTSTYVNLVLIPTVGGFAVSSVLVA